MQRKEAMIAAGTLTGLMIFTVAALGLGPSALSSDAQAAQATIEVATSPAATAQSAPTAAAGALQAPEVQRVVEQNEQLRQAVQLMQEREAAYRAQLEAANQAILSLQKPATVVEGAVANPVYGATEQVGEQHEGENERGEHEHGEHEDNEHAGGEQHD